MLKSGETEPSRLCVACLSFACGRYQAWPPEKCMPFPDRSSQNAVVTPQQGKHATGKARSHKIREPRQANKSRNEIRMRCLKRNQPQSRTQRFRGVCFCLGGLHAAFHVFQNGSTDKIGVAESDGTTFPTDLLIAIGPPRIIHSRLTMGRVVFDGSRRRVVVGDVLAHEPNRMDRSIASHQTAWQHIAQ